MRVAAVKGSNDEVTGAVEMFRSAAGEIEREHRLQELEQLAIIDQLTGIHNRRFAEASVQSRLGELERYDWPFGVLYMDIDFFKKINDTHGHDRGDEVLKMVATTLAHAAREFDVMWRFGGEEFLAVIANVNSETLGRVAERFRMLVQNSSLRREPPITVTISIGGAVATATDTIDSLLKRADENLYRSKTSGRNRVTL